MPALSKSRTAGWTHYRAAVRMYAAELRRSAPRWTAFDYRMRLARDAAARTSDSLLVGATLELQASRWEVAGYQGEVLAALGGALWAYQHLRDPAEAATHTDRIKQRLANWFELPRAFVSYARSDVRRVRTLVTHLERAHPGAQLVWDDRDFIPGGDLSASIALVMDYVRAPSRVEVASVVQAAFRVAGVYLVMWSRAYASRPWTRWELELATDHLAALRRRGFVGPRLVFVRLDAHPIPVAYRDALWIDAGAGLRRAATRAALSRAITQSDLFGPRRAGTGAPSGGRAPAARRSARDGTPTSPNVVAPRPRVRNRSADPPRH